MSLYTKLKIILSFVLALIISILVYNYINSLKEEVSVVVAAKDIPQRVWIEQDMLKVVKLRKSDKEILAPNAAPDLKYMENAISKIDISSGKVINKNTDIIAGSIQTLTDEKVINKDRTINYEYFIDGNHRLVTVRVDSQGAVNNMLKNGDYVDIIYTSTISSNLFSADILQHIEVFSIEKIRDNDGESYQNITLSVTPQEAVDIVFAKRNGKIDLVLNAKNGEEELITPSNLKKITDRFLNK